MQPNRLAREKSPYLLQHARNPVDWYPWGDEAFVEAARTDRPVFLSIGYATCHWCHVMERESFENAAVAAVLNRHFVSVKVDREERPDVDQVYMTVCQMLTGRGGWPLTLLLTPDRRPFFAATYLPRESRPGQTGLLDLLPRVVELWRADRERLLGSADQIVEALRQGATADLSGEAPETDLLDQAAAEYAARFDPTYGGFGGAPKFPSPHNLTFLLRYGRRSRDADASEMVYHTLDHMRRGGLFDQIGFGFHRYSTDERWLVPHFEKMLYDQAGLAAAYLEAWQASGETRHRETAQRVLAYVKRDLTSPEGGFYSAEDADSEGEEGRYYVWRVDELNDVLPEEDRVFAAEAYGIRPEGNYRDESTGRRTGANIPILAADGGPASGDPVGPARLEAVRERLLSARGSRVRPLLDDKVMTDWNGLMIGAFARAAWTLEDASYLETAKRAADFVLECLRDGEGRLWHRWREGEAGLPAHLDDYAFLVHGLIELYQASFEARYLSAAIDLNHQMILLFEDPQGGFTFTSVDRDPLLARLKETYDGAHPSGNSVALHNLVRLSRLTGRTDWEDVAHRTMGALAEPVRRMPTGHGHFLSGIALALGASLEIVIAGEPDREDTRDLLSVLRRAYLPHAVLHVRHTGNRDALAELAPYTAMQEPIDGRATAYVCRSFACEHPTTKPSELVGLLVD